MKVRNGFVSNSSSSSFMCSVCHALESGYDASLREMGMVECMGCGSTMCEDHVHTGKPTDDEMRSAMLADEFLGDAIDCEDDPYAEVKAARHGDLVEMYEAWLEHDNSHIGPHECPICTLKHLDAETTLDYLCKKLGLQRAGVQGEIRAGFKDLNAVQEFLK